MHEGLDSFRTRLHHPALWLRYLEVETREGRVLHRSGNLQGLDLKGAGGTTATMAIGGQEARIRSSQQGRLVLHLGTRLGTLEKTQQDLGLSLVMVLPLVALVAFGGGLLLARRALRPVTALTAAAEKISTERPDERLPVLPGGDEVARLTEVLNHTFDRLQRAYAAAARFSADASHQLKTPVSVLRAGLDALHHQSLPPEAQMEIEVLRRQSRRLTTMIGDLLLLAQADAGRLQLETARMDLVPLLERTGEDLEVLSLDRGLTLEQDWPATLPCTADPRRVAIILQNLTENAAKYTPAGGNIRIQATTEGADSIIRITNTGTAYSSGPGRSDLRSFPPQWDWRKYQWPRTGSEHRPRTRPGPRRGAGPGARRSGNRLCPSPANGWLRPSAVHRVPVPLQHQPGRAG